MSNSLRPHGMQPAKLLCPWNSPGKNTGVGSHSVLQGNLPNPRNKPRSPTLKADSLSSELPGKPKKTGVGSLSLLQETFLTQGSNWGLLHCRQILYQLSYQGSPYLCLSQVKIFTFANEKVESNITTIPFLLKPSHAQTKSTRVLP